MNAPHRAVAWLLDNEDFKPAHPGLIRYLGWTALALYLRPLVDAFSIWREEEHWLCELLSYLRIASCHGSVNWLDPGRMRLLSCGCCGTRWRYRRIGCPFCESGDDHRLAALSIEGESHLRIDYCDSCHAYLKTYVWRGERAPIAGRLEFTSPRYYRPRLWAETAGQFALRTVNNPSPSWHDRDDSSTKEHARSE